MNLNRNTRRNIQIKYNRLYLNQFKPEECLPPYIKDTDYLHRHAIISRFMMQANKQPTGYYLGAAFLFLAWVIFSVFGLTGC